MVTKLFCGIVTLFPEMFTATLDGGVVGRAIKTGLLNLSFYNIRDFANNKHNSVDDRPFGGGPGMVLQYLPLKNAVLQAKQDIIDKNIAHESAIKVLYMTPQGKQVTSNSLKSFLASNYTPIFVAGRYEGVDERFIEAHVDEEWSIGDYVLSGGELAIMVALDAMARFIPGTLGCGASALEDSFANGLLDYPHYTRPSNVDGYIVPKVLISGDHLDVAKFRSKQQLGRTWKLRPDLLEKISLSKEQQDLLAEFIEESGEHDE